MKHYPRAFNRIWLFLLGLTLVAAGAGIILVSLWSPARLWWQTNSSAWIERSLEVFRANTIRGTDVSWVVILAVSAWIILCLVILVIVFSQGGGKRLLVAQQKSARAAGKTQIQVDTLQPLVSAMAQKNRWIADCSVSAWNVKRKPAIQLTVQCYKGADPAKIADFMSKIVSRVDTVLGVEMPVLLRITTGWHTTFSSKDRVR